MRKGSSPSNQRASWGDRLLYLRAVVVGVAIFAGMALQIAGGFGV